MSQASSPSPLGKPLEISVGDDRWAVQRCAQPQGSTRRLPLAAKDEASTLGRSGADDVEISTKRGGMMRVRSHDWNPKTLEITRCVAV